jgi:hypothetical protein
MVHRRFGIVHFSLRTMHITGYSDRVSLSVKKKIGIRKMSIFIKETRKFLARNVLTCLASKCEALRQTKTKKKNKEKKMKICHLHHSKRQGILFSEKLQPLPVLNINRTCPSYKVWETEQELY